MGVFCSFLLGRSFKILSRLSVLTLDGFIGLGFIGCVFVGFGLSTFAGSGFGDFGAFFALTLFCSPFFSYLEMAINFVLSTLNSLI